MVFDRKTPKELNDLANDAVQGRIFIANTADRIKNSFGMLLMFMSDEGRKSLIDAKVSMFYEYYSEASPMAVNGQPQFFSGRFLVAEDYDIFASLYNAKLDLLGV